VRQLMTAVTTAAGRSTDSIKMRIMPARPGEVTRNCLDRSRAKNEELMSQATALDAGIRATLEWMRRAWE